MYRCYALLGVLIISSAILAEETQEAAVWAAVESRNATWAADDQAGHIGIYHPELATRKKGDVILGNSRFSGVYVFADDQWLYVGGHRDGMALSSAKKDGE